MAFQCSSCGNYRADNELGCNEYEYMGRRGKVCRTCFAQQDESGQSRCTATCSLFNPGRCKIYHPMRTTYIG